MYDSYRERVSLEKRMEECERMKAKHPGWIPIIAEKFSGDKNLPVFHKNRYIVPPHTTVGHFSYMIRSAVYVKPTMALFLFAKNYIPPGPLLLGELYERCKEDDGFLYIVVCSETTFGTSFR